MYNRSLRFWGGEAMDSIEQQVADGVKELLDAHKEILIEDNSLIDKFPDFSAFIMTAIAVHNRDLYYKQKASLEKKEDYISKLEPLNIDMSSPVVSTNDNSIKEEQEGFTFYKPALDKYEELTELCETRNDVIDCLGDVDDSHIIDLILLLFYEKINQLISDIRHTVNDIQDSANQKELKRLRFIFETIKNYEKCVTEDIVNYPTVILFDDGKNGNIYEFVEDNFDNINKFKGDLEKFFRGEKTNVEKIKGYKEKLMATLNANGTRLLFFDLGNNTYVLADMFIKGATVKGAKNALSIEARYARAVRNFKKNREMILANMDTEEFKNRQAELIHLLFGKLKSDEVIIDGRKI